MTDVPVIVTRSRRDRSDSFIFEKTSVRKPGQSSKISGYREAAWDHYASTAMPALQDEAWRRTDLRGLNPGQYKLVEPAQHEINVPASLLNPLTAEVHGGQIVLGAGCPRISLDESLKSKGVVFTDLLTAEEKYPQLLEKVMGEVVKADEGKFSALAGALAQTGVLLYIPRGVAVEAPFHSLIWGEGSGLAYVSHVMVYLEAGASATYVHEYASEDQGQNLHVGNLEVYVGPGANLRFVELQSWGDKMWNFTHERARVDQDGSIDWVFGSVGSRLTKNFSELELAGKGSTGRMSGFYFANGKQHLDHDTQQNHLKPHTTSDLLFKGALLDESRSVWQGMIYVAPGAEKADGYQANRNLLLSQDARADSIPGLEILADDVRCTHGATVGQLDQDQVFYLMSRGIPRHEAEPLIVGGFFDPIMQRIPFAGVRDRFEAVIQSKMASYSK